MRWFGWTVRLAVVATMCGAVCMMSCASPKPVEMTLEEKLARGRALTWIAGCNDCHTPGGLFGAPDTSRMLAGSELGWRGPWGVTYARNLTPHETGLASWSEDDIVKALRIGQRPDGSPIQPPMPWVNFSRLSDEDAQAIAMFLKSLPPVDHRVPDAIPPDGPATGPEIVFPIPPAWDAPVAAGAH